MTDFIGAIANMSSLILWLPQAMTTYNNRRDREALKGISYGTQIMAAINTILWCIYGFLISSLWLPMGTIIVLPLALWTLWLKHSVENDVFSDLKSRTIASKNELVESSIEGYFNLYMGNKVLCDHKGHQTTVKLDSTTKVIEYCQKHKIDTIKFNPKHHHN